MEVLSVLMNDLFVNFNIYFIFYLTHFNFTSFFHYHLQNTLDDIAFLIQHVKSFLPSSDESAQSHLFMELVADLAREMENF